jgi:hypothetical protein
MENNSAFDVVQDVVVPEVDPSPKIITEYENPIKEIDSDEEDDDEEEDDETDVSSDSSVSEDNISSDSSVSEDNISSDTDVSEDDDDDDEPKIIRKPIERIPQDSILVKTRECFCIDEYGNMHYKYNLTLRPADENHDKEYYVDKYGTEVKIVREEIKETVTRVDWKIINLINLLRQMMIDIGDDGTDDPVPLDDYNTVPTSVFLKIVEYCEYYKENSDIIEKLETGFYENKNDENDENGNGPYFKIKNTTTWDIEGFDAKFLNYGAKVDVENPFNYYIYIAANFLEIKPLVRLMGQYFAATMDGLTPEQIRKRHTLEDNVPEERKKEIIDSIVWTDS